MAIVFFGTQLFIPGMDTHTRAGYLRVLRERKGTRAIPRQHVPATLDPAERAF